MSDVCFALPGWGSVFSFTSHVADRETGPVRRILLRPSTADVPGAVTT